MVSKYCLFPYTLSVEPTTVTLQSNSFTFQENVAKVIECRVPSVKPGKEHIKFTVKIGGETATSTDSQLEEGEGSPNTDGAVSVTYKTSITLQRQHNNKVIICSMTWMAQTQLVKQLDSNDQTVIVQCKLKIVISVYNFILTFICF